MVETSSKPVPIIPEEVLKYFLPNNPSKTNPAKGNKGINAMYDEYFILIFHFACLFNVDRTMTSI